MARTYDASKALFERAQRVIPGGVNSPVRACRSVGADPVFVAQGDGATITDADGNTYIDLISSWGPLILGHTHGEVLDAIAEAMALGTTFGAPTEIEVRFAEAVTEAMPVDRAKVRAVSSGTEATMSALRLARGFTGRAKVVKMDGGYHGHADAFLVAAGSGAATLGIPGSAGVPDGAARDTLVVPYNDLDAAAATFAANPGEIAAVIVEPVAGNMGVVPPADGYLAGLPRAHRRARRAAHLRRGHHRLPGRLRRRHRPLRGHPGPRHGRQDRRRRPARRGVRRPSRRHGPAGPGRRRLPGRAPSAGTRWPWPPACGSWRSCARPGTYERLEQAGARLGDGLLAAARATGHEVCANRIGLMMTMFFTAGPVTDYASARRADTAKFAAFYRGMRDRGIFWAPSQFEAAFVSLAHSDNEIDEICAAAREVLAGLK